MLTRWLNIMNHFSLKPPEVQGCGKVYIWTQPNVLERKYINKEDMKMLNLLHIFLSCWSPVPAPESCGEAVLTSL